MEKYYDLLDYFFQVAKTGTGEIQAVIRVKKSEF
jgi:hypothetical protein